MISLPYASWEYVLQYMSVDSRLALSKRCPAIRNLDHRIPLRIDEVKIANSCISINKGQSTYQLSVIEIIPGKINSDVREGNHRGETTGVDRYGDSPMANQRISDKRIEWLEKQIVHQESRVEYQRGLAPSEWSERFLQAFQQKIVEWGAEIEEIRKNGYIPPHTLYLQLISDTQFGRKVERFEYKESILTATRYLFEKLFPSQMLTLVDIFKPYGLAVSLPHPPRRVELKVYTSGFPLNGLEAELQIDQSILKADEMVQRIMSYEFKQEKSITSGVFVNPRVNTLDYIKSRPGAQLSDTPGHVTVPNRKHFKITFHLSDNGWILYAKVERK